MPPEADVKISHQSLSKQFIHQTKVLTNEWMKNDSVTCFAESADGHILLKSESHSKLL